MVRLNTPYPRPYVEYLAEYHGSRNYFVCHDIMEEYWKEVPGSRYSGCWLVFIRIAVACYHARRGNWTGARKLMAKAAEEIAPALMNEIGMDGIELQRRIRSAAEAWNQDAPAPVFLDIELPIADPALLAASRTICLERGWTWGLPLTEVPADVVQYHRTRDRRPVVEARRRAAEEKIKSRNNH